MKMPDQVSPRQVELLVEFAETHTPIGLGPFQWPKASQAAQQVWESLAMQLNSLAEGTTKAPDQWHIISIEETAAPAANLIEKAAIPDNLNLQMEVKSQEDIPPPLPSLPPPNIVQREEIRHDPDFPHWAYDWEMRRIDSKDRQNVILEKNHNEIQLLRETLQKLVEVIKENNNQ